MKVAAAARTLALAILVAVTSGCVIRHGDFTVLSNKLVRTSDFELSKAERQRAIVGEDIAHIIFFVPTTQPTLEGAIDDAIRRGKGDVITDAVVEQFFWYIPLIYGQSGWRVRGDVVKTRKN